MGKEGRGGFISYFIPSKMVAVKYPRLREVSGTIKTSGKRDKILAFLYRTLGALKVMEITQLL